MKYGRIGVKGMVHNERRKGEIAAGFALAMTGDRTLKAFVARNDEINLVIAGAARQSFLATLETDIIMLSLVPLYKLPFK